MKKIFILSIILLSLISIGYFFTRDQGKMVMDSPKSTVKETNAPNTVHISDYTFSPSLLQVKKGTTVTWINKDIARHNVAIDEEGTVGPNGPLIGKEESYSYTFTEVGSYNYHCDPHPYMKGVVEVIE